MPLSDSELVRYKRHLLLKEVGGAGQQRLKAARVLVVGAGGLGAPCLLYLAAAGVGTLGLVDDDTVELSNLQRQVLYTTADLGRPKAEAAAERLAALNPDIRIESHPVRLTAETAGDLLAPYDLVCDGSDSYATRRAVNAAAMALGRPLVSAAVGRFEGQLALFRGRPCYRCLFPHAPPGEDRCAADGILGTVAGLLGVMQASLVLDTLLGLSGEAAGRLHLVDAVALSVRHVRIGPDPGCPDCAGMETGS
ncbi:MAG: HesA/MoeB/ThiF family protein [Alphaproteobacteria bacterium]|nr:HesA/MoeB/ThiF family protein [Alphaproteobacteria bacterium]